MAAVPMAKIVLKNTTKMSLNERFTAYRQQAQSTVNNIRQKMQLQRQASLENRRLAQQMANRPSVIAALRLKKRSLQQRLGQKRLGQGTVSSPTSRGNVKARLNLNVRQNVSSVQGRLGGQRSNRGRGAARRGVKRTNRNGTVRSGTSPMLKARLGSQNTSRYGYGSSYRQTQNRGGNYRRGRGSYNRNRRQTRNNFRGQYRRGGGGGGNNRGRSGQARGGGGGGGWSRGAGRKIVPTKQELDNQLDEYMAETKSHLDAELDAYMAQGE